MEREKKWDGVAMKIPMGNRKDDITIRRHIIANYYRIWKRANPSMMRYNHSLKEAIAIRFVSITETCTHAARSFHSTLAILHLDNILTYAKKVGTVPAKSNGNQKPFEKMIVMRYDNASIGTIRMTVGVRRRTHEKVQYCITAID